VYRLGLVVSGVIALHPRASAQTTFSALDSSPISAPTGKTGAQINLEGIQFESAPTLRIEFTPASIVRDPKTVSEHLEQLGGVGPNLNRLRFSLAIAPRGGDSEDADRIGAWELGARWDIYNSASPWAINKTYGQLSDAISRQAIATSRDEMFQNKARAIYMRELRQLLTDTLPGELRRLCFYEPAKLADWKPAADKEAVAAARQVCEAAVADAAARTLERKAASASAEATEVCKTDEAAAACTKKQDAATKAKDAAVDAKSKLAGSPSQFEIDRRLDALRTAALEDFDQLKPSCLTAIDEDIGPRFSMLGDAIETAVDAVCETSVKAKDTGVLDEIRRAATGGVIVTLEGQIRRGRAEMEGDEREREVIAQALVTYRSIQPVYTCELSGLAAVGLRDSEEPTSRLGLQINCDPARGQVFGSGVVAGFEALLDSKKLEDGSERAWFLELGPKLSVPLDKRVQAGAQITWSRRTDARERFESRATFLLAWVFDQSGAEIERRIRLGDAQ
jgi:hypothetical protein